MNNMVRNAINIAEKESLAYKSVKTELKELKSRKHRNPSELNDNPD